MHKRPVLVSLKSGTRDSAKENYETYISSKKSGKSAQKPYKSEKEPRISAKEIGVDFAAEQDKGLGE